jgi:hypothetical protein
MPHEIFDFRIASGIVLSAFGGEYKLYAKPASLDSLYGAHPMCVVMFVRFRAVPLNSEGSPQRTAHNC